MTESNKEELPTGQTTNAWNGGFRQKTPPTTSDDRHTVGVVELNRPARRWMATRQDLPWLTDITATTLHADDPAIRWDCLGAILTEISNALTDGNYVAFANFDEPIQITIRSGPADGLATAELAILKTWSNSDTAPRGDLLSPHLSAAELVWNVWKHAPEAILPVHSAVLDYEHDIDAYTDGFAAAARSARITRDYAAAQLRELTAAQAKRSPLYVTELVRATTITAHYAP